MNSVHSRPLVLCIAGFDPTGGAGLLADVRTLGRLGIRAGGIYTAATHQRPTGPVTTIAADPAYVARALDEWLADFTPAAIKIGMLGDKKVAAVVADKLAKAPVGTPLVIDPVLTAGAGGCLTDDEAVTVLREQLAPRATVLTPNVPEVARLLGQEPATSGDLENAGRRLRKWGAEYVFVKGGHLPGDPVDLLIGPAGTMRFEQQRLPGRPVHGTGCTLAAALAGGLALSETVPRAVARARTLVYEGIAGAWAPQREGWRFLD